MGSRQPVSLSLALALFVTLLAGTDRSHASARNWLESKKRVAGFSIGAPALLNLHGGIEAIPGLWLEISGGGLVLPTPSMSFSQWNLDIGTKYFHRGRYFFVGLFLRYLGLGIDGNNLLIQSSELDGTESPDIRLGGLYIVPQIGVRIPLSQRLFLTFDLGVQFGLITHGSIHSSRDAEPWGPAPSAIYQGLARSSSRALRHLARTPLPSLSLLRLTWELE